MYSYDATSATVGGEFVLGNNQVANLRCQDTSISSLSDERDKTNIVDIAIIVSTVEISMERLEAKIYEKLSRIKIGTKYEIRKNK